MKINFVSVSAVLQILTAFCLLGAWVIHVDATSVKSDSSRKKPSACKPHLSPIDINQQKLRNSGKFVLTLNTGTDTDTAGSPGQLACGNRGTNSILRGSPWPRGRKTKRSIDSTDRATFYDDGGHSRKRRSLRLDSFSNADVRKVLELVVVADVGHVSANGGQSNDTARIQQIVNLVNGVYQPFGLRVVLTKVVALTSSAFSLAQPAEGLLRDFSVYKIFNVDVRHDVAILLVANSMTNVISPGLSTTSTLIGWTTGLCSLFQSSAVVSDVGETGQTAWFMAHAIGAQLGFKNVEDGPGCTCSALNGCVMSAFLGTEYGSTKLVNWDSCSADSWSSQADAIWRSCLKDAPNASYPYAAATHCGNGIVDSGEQCDCGPALTCTSACCNPNTCTFKAGAECASGSCCNTTTCRLKPRGQVCRDTEGPCDVAETCDGVTEWCPSDDRVSDGVVCAPSASFCYNGECKSRDSQCKVLFDANATVANSACFTTINVVTNAGFCHKTLIAANATNLQYSTVRCTNANAMCGLLHCSMPTAPALGNTYTLGASSCSSQWGIDFSSSGLRSPAMVPDGASCGISSMCVNSSCEAVSKFACSDCPDCHGNGVTTRGKLCYCRPGFAPPDCSSAGCGGSLTSPLMLCDGVPTTQTPPAKTTEKPTSTMGNTNITSTVSASGIFVEVTLITLLLGSVIPVVTIALVSTVVLIIFRKRLTKSPAKEPCAKVEPRSKKCCDDDSADGRGSSYMSANEYDEI